MEKYDLLKDLTNGFSEQSKLSNKYWLVLLFLSVLSIINIKPDQKADAILNLPFNFGEVDYSTFQIFILLMICTSTIAYASAYLQTHRTRILIQRLIEYNPKSAEKKIEYNIHLQDIFDCTVSPTFNRVGPIAQFLQSKNQFLTDEKPNLFNRLLGSATYVFLKLFTLAIIFGIPLVAIIRTIITIEFENSNWFTSPFILWLVSIVAISLVLTLVISDIYFIARAMKRIWAQNDDEH